MQRAESDRVNRIFWVLCCCVDAWLAGILAHTQQTDSIVNPYNMHDAGLSELAEIRLWQAMMCVALDDLKAGDVRGAAKVDSVKQKSFRWCVLRSTWSRAQSGGRWSVGANKTAFNGSGLRLCSFRLKLTRSGLHRKAYLPLLSFTKLLRFPGFGPSVRSRSSRASISLPSNVFSSIEPPPDKLILVSTPCKQNPQPIASITAI